MFSNSPQHYLLILVISACLNLPAIAAEKVTPPKELKRAISVRTAQILSIASLDDVQAFIELSKAQSEKVSKLSVQMVSLMRNAGKGDERDEIVVKTLASLVEELSQEQFSKLCGIAVSSYGLEILASPYAAKSAKLTDEETQKIFDALPSVFKAGGRDKRNELLKDSLGEKSIKKIWANLGEQPDVGELRNYARNQKK